MLATQATFVWPECVQTPSSVLYPHSGIISTNGGFYFIPIFKPGRSRLREGLMGRAGLNKILCLAPTKATALVPFSATAFLMPSAQNPDPAGLEPAQGVKTDSSQETEMGTSNCSPGSRDPRPAGRRSWPCD